MAVRFRSLTHLWRRLLRISGLWCLVGRQAAIQAAPGSITSKRRLRPGSPVVEVQLLVPQPRWPVLQHQPTGRPVQRRLNQPPDPGGQPCCQVARMARGRSRATGPAFRSVLVNALRGRCPCGRAARSPQARTVTDSVVPANPAWQYLHRSEAIWRCRERSVKPSAQPTLVRTQHLPHQQGQPLTSSYAVGAVLVAVRPMQPDAARSGHMPARRPGDPRISGTSGPGQTGITGRQSIKRAGPGLPGHVRRLRDRRRAS